MNKVSCNIITIGDEILYGHILDTNSKWLSQELNKIGVKIFEKKSIGDDYDQINDSLKNSLSNYDITILTGGLGPTNDDITKNCLNDYFKGKLIFHKKTLNQLIKRPATRSSALSYHRPEPSARPTVELDPPKKKVD